MKVYTFQLVGAFTLQHSFSESEMQRDPEGGDSDVVPTDAALVALGESMREALGQHYSVESMDLDADGALLVGIEDEGDA